MAYNPFDRLIVYEGIATTTEQKVSMPNRLIERIVVTGAQAVTFSFDRSATADDHPFGLRQSYALLKELMEDYIGHCNYGMREAYALLTQLRDKYIAHCAMGAGTHKVVDAANKDVVAIESTSLAHMIAAANSLKAKYNAHDNDASTYHLAAGTAHQISAADASDLVTLIDLLNEIRTDFIAHIADDTLHTAADTTNTVSLAALTVASHKAADTTNNNPTALTAQTLEAMIASANSLKAKYNAHDADASSFHQAAGTAAQVSADDATSLSTLITLLNAIKTAFTSHMADATPTTGAHYNADTIHSVISAPATVGTLTLTQNEQTPQLNLVCQDVYFKAASATSTFKIYGLTNAHDLNNYDHL